MTVKMSFRLGAAWCALMATMACGPANNRAVEENRTRTRIEAQERALMSQGVHLNSNHEWDRAAWFDYKDRNPNVKVADVAKALNAYIDLAKKYRADGFVNPTISKKADAMKVAYERLRLRSLKEFKKDAAKIEDRMIALRTNHGVHVSTALKVADNKEFEGKYQILWNKKRLHIFGYNSKHDEDALAEVNGLMDSCKNFVNQYSEYPLYLLVDDNSVAGVPVSDEITLESLILRTFRSWDWTNPTNYNTAWLDVFQDEKESAYHELAHIKALFEGLEGAKNKFQTDLTNNTGKQFP